MSALAWLDERLLSGVEKVMWRSQLWIGLDMFFWAKVLKKSYILCVIAHSVIRVMAGRFTPIEGNSLWAAIWGLIFTVGIAAWIWFGNTPCFETDPSRIRRMMMSGLSNPNKITRPCMFNRKFWTVGTILIPAVFMDVDLFLVSLLCMVLWMYTISSDPLPVQPSRLKEFLHSFSGKTQPVSP